MASATSPQIAARRTRQGEKRHATVQIVSRYRGGRICCARCRGVCNLRDLKYPGCTSPHCQSSTRGMRAVVRPAGGWAGGRSFQRGS